MVKTKFYADERILDLKFSFYQIFTNLNNAVVPCLVSQNSMTTDLINLNVISCYLIGFLIGEFDFSTSLPTLGR